MIRFRPRFARKNLYAVFSFRLPGKPRFSVPLPLFIIDELAEGFALLSIVLARRVPYLDAIAAGYDALRWKGSFTLVDVDLDATSVKIRFI
jgi:hypothetical protein